MFHKEMSIMEALQVHPKSSEVFKKHGMACLNCMGAIRESIQVAADMHGMNIEQLMKELNDLAREDA